MKNLLSEFSSSIYNPSFYKNINDKSLKHIFSYMTKVSLVVATIFSIALAIGSLISLNQTGTDSLIIILILAIIAGFLTILLTTFITWLIYGWVIGVALLGVSIVFRRRIPYTTSVKTSMYAMSIGVLITIIPFIPYRGWLGLVLPIIIILINLRKK